MALNVISCLFLILDKPNKIKSERCDSKNQRPEISCSSKEVEKRASDRHMQKESSMQANGKSAIDGKVSASKPRSRTGRKHGAKK